MWRVIVFSFFVHLFAYISNAASYDIQRHWCGTKPWVEGLFHNVLAYLLMAMGVGLTKRYFLNTSWRKLLAITTVLMACIIYTCAIIVDRAWIRSQFFYLGAPLINQLVLGVFFIVCSYCAVEVAEPGDEGATYGLMTTVGNLSIPFANVLSATLASHFKIYDATGKLLDTPEARNQMLYLDTTIFVINLLAVPMLFILPRQKNELQALIATGQRSPRIAILVVLGLIFCFCWSIMGNFLQIFESTSCLRMVGGRGCK